MKAYKYLFLIAFLFGVPSVFAQNLVSPESVVYDYARSQYYVSDVKSQYTDDGTIYTVQTSGSMSILVSNLKDPKGMAIVGDSLYVADLTKLIVINLSTKTKVFEQTITDPSGFLNDICTDGKGYLYFTNTAQNKVHRVPINNLSAPETINFFGNLNAPNGIIYSEKKNCLYVVTFESPASIKAISLETLQLTTVTTPPFDYCDGITRDNKGFYYISSWTAVPPGAKVGKVFKYDEEFALAPETFATGFDGPADLFYDTANSVLAIPNMNGARVDYLKISENFPAPLLDYPVNNALDMGQIIEFKWEEVPGAPKYRIQVDTLDSFATPTKDVFVTANSAIINNLLTSHKYYWRVKAVGNQKDGEWSSTRNFTVSVLSYKAPELILPENNKQYVSVHPTFVWTSSPTQLYKMQIADEETFANPNIRITDLTDTTYTLTATLLKDKIYYWRMKTYSGAVESEWSETFAFRTNEFAFPQATLMYPYNNQLKTELKPIFKWRSHTGAKYFLKVNSMADFAGTSYISESNLTDTTFNTIYELPENKMIFWKVGLYNDDTLTWSGTYKFTTADMSAIIEANSSSISISPNPAKDVVTVELPEANNFEWTISDMSGNAVLSGKSESSNFRINISSFDSGAYILMINSKNKIFTKKFEVVK